MYDLTLSQAMSKHYADQSTICPKGSSEDDGCCNGFLKLLTGAICFMIVFQVVSLFVVGSWLNGKLRTTPGDVIQAVNERLETTPNEVMAAVHDLRATKETLDARLERIETKLEDITREN